MAAAIFPRLMALLPRLRRNDLCSNVMRGWGACISAPHGFVWAPSLHLSHYAATADWLISGSFHSPRLPIFRYGFLGDLFALPMRLAIWPLLDPPAVTENRRGLGNCDFGMDQLLVWPATIRVESSWRHGEKKLDRSSILIRNQQRRSPRLG